MTREQLGRKAPGKQFYVNGFCDLDKNKDLAQFIGHKVTFAHMDGSKAVCKVGKQSIQVPPINLTSAEVWEMPGKKGKK